MTTKKKSNKRSITIEQISIERNKHRGFSLFLLIFTEPSVYRWGKNVTTRFTDATYHEDASRSRTTIHPPTSAPSFAWRRFPISLWTPVSVAVAETRAFVGTIIPRIYDTYVEILANPPIYVSYSSRYFPLVTVHANTRCDSTKTVTNFVLHRSTNTKLETRGENDCKESEGNERIEKRSIDESSVRFTVRDETDASRREAASPPLPFPTNLRPHYLRRHHPHHPSLDARIAMGIWISFQSVYEQIFQANFLQYRFLRPWAFPRSTPNTAYLSSRYKIRIVNIISLTDTATYLNPLRRDLFVLRSKITTLSSLLSIDIVCIIYHFYSPVFFLFFFRCSKPSNLPTNAIKITFY